MRLGPLDTIFFCEFLQHPVIHLYICIKCQCLSCLHFGVDDGDQRSPQSAAQEDPDEFENFLFDGSRRDLQSDAIMLDGPRTEEEYTQTVPEDLEGSAYIGRLHDIRMGRWEGTIGLEGQHISTNATKSKVPFSNKEEGINGFTDNIQDRL